MEKYELLKKIGEGTYGIVYKAQNKSTGTYVAIKKFKDSDDDEYVRKTALREIRILKQLKHDHIVDLLEVFREDNRIFLVFEQLNRTILDELQGRSDYSGIEPLEAKKIIWQMLKACEFMHSHNIVHRDFKPENMLLSRNGVLKICDFGFARQLTTANIQEQVPLTEYVSTRWYRSPELLVGAPTYTHAVDVWAIGCIFVELVTGSAIFTGDSDFEMLKLIIRMFNGSEKLPDSMRETFAKNNLFKNVQLPIDDETAEFNFDDSLEAKLAFLGNNSAVSFARECLRMDPGQRPTAEQLLEHDYFNDFRDWFEDEIQTLMEYDQQEMSQGLLGKKQRESALKTRRIENLLGGDHQSHFSIKGQHSNVHLLENPVASTSQPNQNLQSQSMSNPFFTNSLKQSEQAAKEDSHSPAAPRDSGTPIRESRISTIQQKQQMQHRQSLNSNQSSGGELTMLKQSSFGKVVYDSNRKTREIGFEENRLKQASSLSPTRMIQDMSRQEAQSQLPMNQPWTNGTQSIMTNDSSVASMHFQNQQLPTFGGGGGTISTPNKHQNSQASATANGKQLMPQQSDDYTKLYSVVIKEDPAEQLSPTFHAKKGFFQANPPGSVILNRNSDFHNQKQKTFRERERERLNNESQNSRGRSVTKININFNGESNPMTSSGTNLNIQGGITGGSPRVGDDPKFYGSKIYASNSSAISGIQTKKTLQSTNSTSNLETHNGASGPAIVTKGAYYPTMRQKQARDNQMLLGLSTIQSGQYHDLQHGVTGIGYSNPNSTTITKTQPSGKVSIPSQSMNFPSFDDDNNSSGLRNLQAGSNQLSSLIQIHNASNATLQQNSQKSIHQTSIGSPTQGVSPKGGPHHQQLLAPSSSSYQFPLQALGQGLTSSSNPSKEQPRLKAMMLRNQSSQSTSPMGHSLTKPLNSVNGKPYNSAISSKQQPPASSHGAQGLNENQNIANQQNQDSAALPKPNVKIVDLQHNLLPFDSGLQGVGQLTATSAGGAIATNTGQQIISDGGVRIDAQSLKNQLKQGKMDASSNLVMSQQQHYLLQQIHSTSSGNQIQHNQHQLPQSSHNGLISKQTSNLLMTSKTPNDIYGFQQKAILHQIFDKNGAPSRSNIMTRHTTPFHQSMGVPGKMTTAGGSNPKLVTIQQLMAAGVDVNNQTSSKGALVTSNILSSGPGGVPGGNRPGVNSSGAAIKKNGSMGLGGSGMGSYANYNMHHHVSSQIQSSYANNKGQSLTLNKAGLGNSGTISASQHQAMLLASTQMPIGQRHPGSSGGQSINSSVKAAYGHAGSGHQINKLSPKGGAGSRLSQGASNQVFTAK